MNRLRLHKVLSVASLAWACALSCVSPSRAMGADGEAIYRRQCASCHGASGEGSDEFPRPLIGDRSIAQLARLIDRTMPEDDPEACVGEDAQMVAAFIHDAFYSKAAQIRNAPARVELSRLTVRQYRNAVADLIGGFRPPLRWDDAERGLKAEYYKSRRFRREDRVLERVDPAVAFNFGVGSPDPEQIEAHEFSIRWEGSVLPPETGEYEFVVKTEHAARLWVNDPREPLIDAWVKSGDDTEYRAPIHLLAGRPVPIKLEFSKAKQGVDDSKKNPKRKPPEVQASIRLEWKRSHRPDEPVPSWCLAAHGNPRSFVVSTPFPPDDRSIGYERGTSISKAWASATTDAAIETAAYVAANLDELSGVKDDNPERAEALREFCRTFAERAFRRPLDDEARGVFVDRQFAQAKDAETAVKRVVLLVLKSPRFLYREMGGADAYDVASRISFGLWDSLPDQALLDAAAAGKLAGPEQVARQAERMVGDLRSRSKLRDFLLYWLRVDHVPDIAKDPEAFPGFDEALASDLRTSLERTVDDLVESPDADFRQLLLGEEIYLNGRLARFYGADLPEDADFRKIAFEADRRAGVLTHPYLLANFAYTSSSSPIHRGVFLARSLLGRSLKPPPEAVSPLAPDLHAGLTTRERVTLQTSPAACMTCHGMINPLGFSLEPFDAVGRYRDEEKGKPVDAAGLYQTRSGETETFQGARELASFLADSEETHGAFVEQLFHHVVKQPIRAFGPDAADDLREAFARADFQLRELLVEIVAVSALPARDSMPNP